MPARVAAYNLLIELSKNCVKNYQIVSEHLISLHHKRRPDNPKQWEVRNCTGLINLYSIMYLTYMIHVIYMYLTCIMTCIV